MKEIEQQQQLAQQTFETFFEQEPEWKKPGNADNSTPLTTRISSMAKYMLIFFYIAGVSLLIEGFIRYGNKFHIEWEEVSTGLVLYCIPFVLVTIATVLLSFIVKNPDYCRSVAKFIGFHYENDAALPEMVSIAQEMGFFPPLGTVKHFWTERNGVILDMYRVMWSHSLGKNQRTILSGYIFSCHMPKTVNGLTILLSDSLTAKYLGKRSGLHRVKLEWLEFEKSFDLFSEDEREAREVLTPDVMGAVYDFYHSMKNDSMCFLFHKNRFSCFYSAGEFPYEQEVQIQELVENLYVMQIWPELLAHKLTARAWQEKEYVVRRTAADLPANIADASGLTPVMHSILEGDEAQFLQYVEESGFDIHQVFIKNGNTLLHLAAANNRLAMAQKLLEKDPSLVSVKNASGQTALDIARDRRFSDMISLLEFV